jgi:chorismate mutase
MKSLAKRFKIVSEVGKLKVKNGFPIHQQSRMEEMLNGRKEDAERLNLDGKLVYNIFDLIHEASINCQEKIAFEFNRKNNKKAKRK